MSQQTQSCSARIRLIVDTAPTQNPASLAAARAKVQMTCRCHNGQIMILLKAFQK